MGEELVSSILLEGLKRLEYRGYDSAGVALIEEKDGKFSLEVEKHVGKVKNLANAVNSRPFTSTLGIAHTRWATHGEPCDRNSHPHVSNGLAIVHNGILENYQSLKKRLTIEGYEFSSDTDSEVLAHLIRHIQSLEPNLKLVEAVTLALSQVRGAYGICVVDQKSPHELIGARKGSPLILGVGDGGIILASDATAVVGKAKKVIYLQDEDIVVATRSKSDKGEYEFAFTMKNMKAEMEELRQRSDSMDSYPTVNSSNQETALDQNIRKSMQTALLAQTVYRAMHDLTLSLDKIEKAGYEHFMLKEIMEQPRVLRDCMRGRVDPETGIVKLSGITQLLDKFLSARRIIICACGTSWHSALVGEYLIESLVKIPVEVEYASEFRYRNPVLFSEDVVIVISQSGETADTLEAIRIAKENGCTTFGLVNVVGSSIARETDAGVYLHVGPEIGVASTKAFTGQVTSLVMVAIDLAHRKGVLSEPEAAKIGMELLSIPDKIERILSDETIECIRDMAATYRYAPNFLYLGRGFNFPVALEGALKLKEISYIHAEGYPAAEMKHGPIALIDQMMPVVLIAPKNDKTYEKVVSAIEEVTARKGNVICITDEGNDDLDKHCEFTVKIPQTTEELSPLLTCIPLQILSYYVAKMRGCAIDQPRNLAKSVTVE